MDKRKFKKGVVFGVFDGLHTGHEYFLKEAVGQVDELIVIVTRPEIVRILKNKEPKFSLEERLRHIKDFNKDLKVFPGDEKLREWKILKEHRPEIILLGHDQQDIGKELKEMNFPHIYLNRWTKES